MSNYAHTLPLPATTADWELLEVHLAEVADEAGRFGSGWGCEASGAWCRLLGEVHDLGKYQQAFQHYLHHGGDGPPHAAAGAALLATLDRMWGLLAAFAVAGHHAGLANAAEDSTHGPTPLKTAVHHASQALADSLAAAPDTYRRLSLPAPPEWLDPRKPDAARHADLWVRMLFSALVDADRRRTAAFYARHEPALLHDVDLVHDDLATLRDRLDATIDAFGDDGGAVTAARRRVVEACRAAADLPPGLFALTVPTGGGKTLSAMSFALRHAVAHGLRRVIVVIPYTSIIEQNARVYRDALGEANVLEHHANLDVEALHERDAGREDRRRLAAENWLSPVVVTTSVQFFESLFSNRPGRCRKLHNVAKSVVVLDEVQTLPPELLETTLDGLRALVSRFGCSVVLSTATPPALTHAAGRPWGLAGVREIVPNPAALSAKLRRVATIWDVAEPTSNEDLAVKLARHDRVLAIVHRRADAPEVARHLDDLRPDGLFHLSALMCPAHRLRVLGEIKARLAGDGPCRVVSTQLVEAGVDLDFPVVYRALGGLDSLAQAAGRCDREGKLTAANGGEPAGKLHVFLAESQPPRGTPRKALQAAQAVLAVNPSPDLFDPATFEPFFHDLYAHRGDVDAREIEAHRRRLNFATVAEKYKLIDEWSEPIVIPYTDTAIDGPARIERYRKHPSAGTRRALQPLTVQVSPQHLLALRETNVVEDVEGVPVLLDATGDNYADRFGLAVEPTVPVTII